MSDYRCTKCNGSLSTAGTCMSCGYTQNTVQMFMNNAFREINEAPETIDQLERELAEANRQLAEARERIVELERLSDDLIKTINRIKERSK